MKVGDGLEIRENGLRYIVQNNEAIVISADGQIPKDLLIPEHINGFPVTEIFKYAFQHSKLETVSIPDTITRIRTGAFLFSESLQRVNILYDLNKKNRVLNIESLAFCACNQLSTFSAPNSVLNLEERSFVDCLKLQECLGEIKICENGALYNCPKLKKIVFTDGATIRRNSLCRNDKLQRVEFRGFVDIDEDVLKYLLSICKIFCTQNSNIADLAYEGHEIKIVR